MPKRVSMEGQVITDHDRLARTLKVLRTQGKVVTLLCTDIDVLGPGAVRALKNAGTRGNHLVVGLLDNAALEARDGTAPLLTQAERGEVVAAVDGVDYVTFIEQGGVEELVRSLRPTVAARSACDDVKGGQIEEEWAKDVGARFALAGDAKAGSNRRFRKAIERRSESAAARRSEPPSGRAKKAPAPKTNSKAASSKAATPRPATPKAAKPARGAAKKTAGKVTKKASKKAARKTTKKAAKKRPGARKAKASAARTSAKKKVRATA